MTETPSTTAITEALALIDDGLGTMLHRELVSSDEVTDLLLDVRSILSARPTDPIAEPEPVLAG